jgi:hypothetical protein
LVPSSAAIAIFSWMSDRLHARSAVLLLQLERRLEVLVLSWLILIALASAARIALSPVRHTGEFTIAPYLLLTLAPVATFLLALRWFADGDRQPQPAIRLARVGRWRSISREAAERHPLYGTTGIMLSLLIGMLMNVPVRAAEYLVTMPAIPPDAPAWLSTLHLAMTLDTVVLSSLYVVAFVMALRRVALFPRFLLLVWIVDILSQLGIAHVSMAVGLPHGVLEALRGLLDANIKKVLISASLWLPYLILSTRVNVTFRNRIPA